jgi:predicted dehydrogenase
MTIHAACDVDDERREAFATEFRVPRVYRDYVEMLREERLDVLHLVTQPTLRVPPIEAAARGGVRAIIVEKPVTLWPSEMTAIRSIQHETGCRIVVNHQRRYFPQYPALRRVLRSGQLGAVEFVRASAHGPILAMGPHLMDLVLYLLDDVSPLNVWATAEGRDGYDWSHAAPNHVLARYIFPENRHVWLECSPTSLGTPGVTEYWMHLHLDFWCTRGRAWIAQLGTWGYQAEGMADAWSDRSNWYDDQLAGQRAFTEAVADWLDDPNQPHACRLEVAQLGFAALTGALYSALVRHQVDLPAPVTDDDLRALREALTR